MPVGCSVYNAGVEGEKPDREPEGGVVERDLIAPLVGLVLVMMGLGLMRWHLVAWRDQRHDPSITDSERLHYRRRYRRRMQTSGLLALLGVLIGAGDALIPWQKFPLLFVGWIALMLLLVVWIILLALGDMASTTLHSRGELARVRQQQRALEQRLEDLKSRRSNGRQSPD